MLRERSMARSKTPSFITELPLKVDSNQERRMLARFQAARQLYNACLNEALLRMSLVKNSEPYQQAKNMRGGDKKRRAELFAQARKQYRFSEYDLGDFGTTTSKASKWMDDKLGSQEKQVLGKRAFKAVEKILFGRAKKVKFKVPSRFRSMQGKSNATGISVKFDKITNPNKLDKGDYRKKIVCSGREIIKVVWNKLILEPIIDWDNPVVVHGIKSNIKYCRILWRNLNGKRRWYVQLINEGLPYQKPQNYTKLGIVGLDINIYNVAFVANYKAGLLPFADKVPTYEKEIKTLQRKMQRSQRINNPVNFELDFDDKIGNKIVRKKGKVKPGKKQWIKSRNYRRIQAKKAEIERNKSAYTKSQNRKLVNDILRHGNVIKTENVSIKTWQKRYGKAISAKSPGFFQSELARKAESYVLLNSK